MPKHTLSIASTLLLTTVVVAAEPTEAQLNAKKVELMQSTKVAARMGLDEPAAAYKSDGDPDTLEIVFLDKIKLT